MNGVANIVVVEIWAGKATLIVRRFEENARGALVRIKNREPGVYRDGDTSLACAALRRSA